jgi:hypothetical protein
LRHSKSIFSESEGGRNLLIDEEEARSGLLGALLRMSFRIINIILNRILSNYYIIM